LTRISHQVAGNQPELLQRGFQIVHDLLRNHIRRRQVVAVCQCIVLEPENIQTGLVARDQLGAVVDAPAAFGRFR